MLGLVSLYAFNKTELYDLKFNFLKVFWNLWLKKCAGHNNSTKINENARFKKP